MSKLLKEKHEAILQIAAKHGAHNVRVFGSVARGETDAQSDIDFLVDLEPGRSLLDLGGLLVDLRDLLEAMENIERYASQGKETFEQDELIQNWIVRHLTSHGRK